MFVFNTASVPSRLSLREPIETLEYMIQTDFKYFDDDGMDLSTLEEYYYKANSITTFKLPTGNTICKRDWVLNCDNTFNLVLNSSYIGLRYSFISRGQFELIKFTKHIPDLVRLLNLTPRWKLNLKLDYISDLDIYNIIHINRIYTDYDKMCAYKLYLENILSNINWELETRLLLGTKDEWKHLNTEDQVLYKLAYFGIDLNI